MTSFETLGVCAPILRAIETLGFDKPTDIQAAAIPILMEGNDLIGVAQTGGGKTAAFTIPMLERLAAYSDKPKPGMPRALILAPTRELAIQITDKIKELSGGTSARCCTVYGGAPYRTQVHILRRGVDILVATPGRLRDHMKQGNIYLDEADYFVLDEADRMLDMGFVEEVRFIAKKLPSGHQSVMFSATMNHKVSELAETLLRDAVRVEAARQATIADNLDHKVMFVPGHKKNDLLLDLIEAEQPEKMLLFVRTRRDADHMADFLKRQGFKTEAIHGDKKQALRQRVINGFRDSRFDVLVATDVAARGIDVTDITHVINMDVPVEAESYVHRIGRTARAGNSGRAITLCGKNDLRHLKDIEGLIKMKIPVDDNHPYKLKMGGPSGARSNTARPNTARSNAPRSKAGGGNKPWDKRAKKRGNTVSSGSNYDPTEEGRTSKRSSQEKPRRGGENAEHRAERTFEKRSDSPKKTTASRKSASNTQSGEWAKPAEAAAKPLTRKTAKRVDPSANKRKAKAGAKKRPAVAARKAKVQQTKAFRKPASGKSAGAKSGGGNQPLRRRPR